MKTVVALRDLRYGGKTYHPGSAFVASGRDAKILVAIGRVQYDLAPVTQKVAALIDTAPVITLVIEAVSMDDKPDDGIAPPAENVEPDRREEHFTRSYSPQSRSKRRNR